MFFLLRVSFSQLQIWKHILNIVGNFHLFLVPLCKGDHILPPSLQFVVYQQLYYNFMLFFILCTNKLAS